MKNKAKKINKIYRTRKTLIIDLTKYYIFTNSHMTTSIEITEFVNHELNSDFDSNFIRKIMKTETRFSFKRAKPRLSNINLDRVKLIRQIFTIKFSKLVSNQAIIINID